MLVEDFHEVYGVDGVAHSHYGVLVAGSVFDQFVQPSPLKGQPHAEHQVGVRYAGDVLRPGLVGVRVGVGRQQGEYLNAVLSNDPDPVGHNVAGGHDVQLTCLLL